MAKNRLSKLKASELEPSELGLDEDRHEFRLSGVLSLTTEDSMNIVKSNGNYSGKVRSNSVDTASNDSHDAEDENDDEKDDSYEEIPEHIQSISSLSNSIRRGKSISVMREKKSTVNFDIVNTRISSGRRKHVLYLLTVTRSPGLDSDKAVIERRYSDFLKLYKELKEKFSEFMETIEFPQKKLIGNLKDSLISERCRLLQNFIRSIHEQEEIRNSDIFKTFFYVSSLQEGCRYMCAGMFEKAVIFLLNGLHLQQKLALDSTNEVIATLGSIVECYNSLKSYDEVLSYSNAALELIDTDLSSVYLVPLLQTLKNAYFVIQDKENLDATERRLKNVVSINDLELAHLPSLRELAVKRFSKK